jgi:phosphatidate cytidylyltransferase
VQNLITRTITGAVFIALIIGSLIAHPFAFAGIIFVIMIAGLLEFFRLANQNEVFPQKIHGLIAGSIIYIILVAISLELISKLFLAFLPLLIMVFFVAEFFRNKPNTMQNIAFSVLPMVYISVPLAMLVFLTGPLITGNNPHWHIAFGFFIILWSDDTFAYLTGIMIGKHKLFEKISPKKTWEGSIGGLIFGFIAAYILSVFFTELNTMQWMGAALIIAVTGTLGDLSESLLKRKFNVKDSGTLLPGHGGVLDRFDSVLFSAPALFCYLVLLNL